MKYLELAQILDLVSIYLLENKKKIEKSRRIRIFFPVNINLSLDAKQLLLQYFLEIPALSLKPMLHFFREWIAGRVEGTSTIPKWGIISKSHFRTILVGLIVRGLFIVHTYINL